MSSPNVGHLDLDSAFGVPLDGLDDDPADLLRARPLGHSGVPAPDLDDAFGDPVREDDLPSLTLDPGVLDDDDPPRPPPKLSLDPDLLEPESMPRLALDEELLGELGSNEFPLEGSARASDDDLLGLGALPGSAVSRSAVSRSAVSRSEVSGTTDHASSSPRPRPIANELFTGELPALSNNSADLVLDSPSEDVRARTASTHPPARKPSSHPPPRSVSNFPEHASRAGYASGGLPESPAERGTSGRPDHYGPKPKSPADEAREEVARHEASVATVRALGHWFYFLATLTALGGYSLIPPMIASPVPAGVFSVVMVAFAWSIAFSFVAVGWGLRHLKDWARLPALVALVPGALVLPIGPLATYFGFRTLLGSDGQYVLGPRYAKARRTLDLSFGIVGGAVWATISAALVVGGVAFAMMSVPEAAPLADGGSDATVETSGAGSRAGLDTPDVPLPIVPDGVDLEITRYEAPLGSTLALATPVGARTERPAILWLAGGVGGYVTDVWTPQSRANDQSARQLREAGLVVMYPGLRGRQNNPGDREGFAGEVDDVLAALRHLAARPDTDASRIYLGGHSTGATLALLAAARAEPGSLRGVFALGPMEHLSRYDEAVAPDLDRATLDARSPITHIAAIRATTVIVEGEHGNATAAQTLAAARGEAPVRALIVREANHFTTLAPTLEVVASAITADTEEAAAFPQLETEALQRRAAGRGALEEARRPGTWAIVNEVGGRATGFTVHIPETRRRGLTFVLALPGDDPGDADTLVRDLVAPGLEDLPALIIAPDVEVAQWDRPARVAFLRALIAHAESEYGVDSDRALLLGHDSGGTGVWALMDDFPASFRASLTIGSYPPPAHACDRPINVVVSTGDTAVPVHDVIGLLRDGPILASSCEVSVTQVENPALGHWQLPGYVSVLAERVPWIRRELARRPRRQRPVGTR